MNKVGFFSRLGYDCDQAYQDKTIQTTRPLEYRLSTDRIHNQNNCLTVFGPRSGHNGAGVSLPIKNKPAAAQAPEVTDIDSILSNRNVKRSKSAAYGVNPIDVTKIKVINTPICNDYLNDVSTRLTHPPFNYRDVGINRFYNLNKNPQAHIFYDFAENTRLTTTDNFHGYLHETIDTAYSLPKPLPNTNKCTVVKQCPIKQ